MINEPTRFVVQLYQFTLLIRDTIFYGFHREFYDVVSYQTRQQQFELFLNEKGIIPQILKRLPDQGLKIHEKIQQFMNLFYRERSQALVIKDGKLMFSLAYIHLLYDHVIVLHQIFSDILKSYLKSSQIQQQLDYPMDQLLQHDAVFFKSLILLGLLNEIEFHSTMLKKLSQKLKEEPSSDPVPKQNIEKRLQFFISVVLDQKRRNVLDHVGLSNAYLEAEKLMDMIQGKMPTPLKDGPAFIQGKPTGVTVNGELRMFTNEVIGMLRDQITLVRNISEQEWLQAFNNLKTYLEESKTMGPSISA